jgi:hypothetical protein
MNKLKIGILECLSALILRYKQNYDLNELRNMTGILNCVKIITQDSINDLVIYLFLSNFLFIIYDFLFLIFVFFFLILINF